MVEDLAPVDLHRRFSGFDRLYGSESGARLREAHIAIVGIGGVGSWAAEALARSGVGQLTLIDMDHIAESNVNRQVHALTETLGMSKVGAMTTRIQQINPQCRVNCVDDFVAPDNWPSLLPPDVIGVIDACDSFAAKISMSLWAMETKMPFVTVGAAGGKRLGQWVEIEDLSRVTHDPLLSKMRYTLRKKYHAPKEGKRIGVQCVFSREPMVSTVQACDAQTDGSLNCHGYGSLVAVTATFGMCAAGWMMDRISTGKS